MATNRDFVKTLTIKTNAKSVGDIRKEIKALRDELLILNSTSTEYAETVDKIRSREETLNEVMHATKQEADIAKGSVAEMRKQLSELAKAWAETGDEAERAELGKKLKELRDKVKEAEESVGDWHRNVGNYTNSIVDAFDKVGGSAGQAITEVKGLTTSFKAFMANPWVALLTAIAMAINGIVNALSNGSEASKRFSASMSGFKAFGDMFSQMFSSVANSVSSLSERLNDLYDKNKMTNFLQGLSHGMQGIVGRAILSITGLQDNFDSWIEKQMDKFDHFRQLEQDIEQQEQSIAKTVGDNIVKIAYYEQLISQQQLIANDEQGKSTEERLKALSLIELYEKDIFDIKYDVAEKEYELAQKVFKIREENGKLAQEDYNNVNQAYANLMNLNIDYTNIKSGLINQNKQISEFSKSAAKEANAQLLQAEKELLQQQLELTQTGSEERLDIEKKIRKNEYDLAVSNAQNSIKNQTALNKTLLALKQAYYNDLEKIDRNNAIDKETVQLGNMNTQLMKMDKSSEDYYNLQIEIAKKEKEIAEIRKDGQSDYEYEQGILQAEENITDRIIELNDYRNEQYRLSLENDMMAYSTHSREYLELAVALAEEELNEVHRVKDESEEAYQQRLLEKEKAYYKAQEELRQSIANEHQLGMENDAQAELNANGESFTYWDLQIAAAENYRDNLFRLQDETNEEYYQRQLEAEQKVIEMKKAKLQSQVMVYGDMANSVSDLLGTVADAYKQQIEQEVKSGKISEKEGKRRFESVKKLQIAQSIISTLTGAINAFMKCQETYPQPYGTIIGAIQAATVTAAGVANINKIKATTIGSTSIDGGQGAVSEINTPTIEGFYDRSNERITNAKTTIDIGNAVKASVQDQRVILVESDLETSENRRRVRISESTY